MKKRLFKLQTLIIAFAVLVSFGFSGGQSYSDTTAGHIKPLIQADQSNTASSIQMPDCDEQDNSCDYEKSQSMHAGECCTTRSPLPFSGPLGAPDPLLRMVTQDLTEMSHGPLLRPPRLTA